MSINMIRTTISRIKRVWAVSFSPGLLRGDVRLTPGEFHMLTSSQSPLPRRSKSSDCACKDRPWRSGDAAGCEEKEVFEDYLSPDMRANDAMHGAPPLYQNTSACRCDECNRIIAEIFGEETALSQDKDLKRRLLANIAQVHITDNIDTSKYATDKAQHGLFQHKKKDDDGLPRLKKDIIDSEANTSTKIKSDSFDELVILNDTTDQTPKKPVDAHQMYTNLYDVDPEEYQCKITNDSKEKSYLAKNSKDHNVDAYWKDVYETAVGENSVYCEKHNLSIDEDTLNVYKVLKNSDSKADGTLEYRRLKLSPRELEKIMANEELFKSSNKSEGNVRRIIRDTTEDQNDDKLIQKVEHIDETPLVEAEKPEVDSSQITPKALGCVGQGRIFNKLDEVAKRCLTSPQNQIDEILLKEMEKLGIPLSLQRSNACLKVDDSRPDTLNKQKRPKGEEIELDDRDIRSRPQKWEETATESKDHPIDPITQFQLDLERTRMNNDFKIKEKANLESDIETESVRDTNRDNRNDFQYWQTMKYQQQQEPSHTEQEQNTFTEQTWHENQLDPKHVLTCNETCSISPKPLIHKNVEATKGTKDTYEQQHTNVCLKSKPLLEEGESEPLPTRAEDEPQELIKADYLNRSKPVDFRDIVQNNESTTEDSVEGEPPKTESYNVTPQELPRREADIEPKVEPKNIEDLTEYTVIQAVDSDQLQLTTEQLQAASEQLQATCSHLQATTEQLQAATTQLQATSNHLCDSSDKLCTVSENLNTTTEKLQYTSENLRESSEKLCWDKHNTNDPKISHDSNEEAERTVKMYEQLINKIPSDKRHLKIANDTLNNEKTNFKELGTNCFSPNIEGWAQQATTINPSVPMAEDLPPMKPLPEIKDNVKLSDLLKMVRERNRLVDCNEAIVLQKPKKPVPPLAKPMANPPMFQMPSIPYVKPFPKVCPPPKKKDTKNCSRCNLEMLGLDQNTSFIGHNELNKCLDVLTLDQHQTVDLRLAEDDTITDIADNFILQLHQMGNLLESSYKRGKAEVLEAAALEKSCPMTKIIRSQDYEPWSPIPSWPYPKKAKEKKLQCPKDGCQIPPPLCEEDRPCGLKPCKTFPTYPKRTFSMLDCYPTTLSDHKIVDVGDF